MRWRWPCGLWASAEAAAVATVSHTAVATVAAIEMAGAVPVLIDIEPGHYTMDPDELEVRAGAAALPACRRCGR